jgi:uncharacterized protein (TIGR02246 family)
MHRRIVALAAAALLVTSARVAAQPTAADVQKITDQYLAAFNKADSKAVAALYTADALRVNPDGSLVTGRAAIEKGYAAAFAGPDKGGKLTLQPGKSISVTADVAVFEGMYQVTGGKMPAKGRYVNTLVRQGGEWRLAAVTTIPEIAPPAK